jgi:hypothetical protein
LLFQKQSQQQPEHAESRKGITCTHGQKKQREEKKLGDGLLFFYRE